MPIVSMKELLESGVHFGHRTSKWNPYMKPYIFTERNDIHIIDLQQTVEGLEESYQVIRDLVAEGGVVLFVGTKRQAQDIIKKYAQQVNMPYVIGRWLGGTLTNWQTIRERIHELERLEAMKERGEFELRPKKEALGMERQIERLEDRLGGIRDMDGLPDLLFVVDVFREEIPVHEANLLRIPVVAMVDTNCNPKNIDYVIPATADAIRAIHLSVSKIAHAIQNRDLTVIILGPDLNGSSGGLVVNNQIISFTITEDLGSLAVIGRFKFQAIVIPNPDIIINPNRIMKKYIIHKIHPAFGIKIAVAVRFQITSAGS